MIYLIGITIAIKNSSAKKSRKFKKLKIPFDSDKELNKFANNLANENERVYTMTKEK